MYLARGTGRVGATGQRCRIEKGMAHPLQSFFGKIKLFSSLSGEELNDLLRAIRPVQYTAGERLFTEGDPGDAAYVIESGELEVFLEKSGKTIQLTTLGPGAILGEISLLDGKPRTASARALGDLKLFRIDKTEFDFLRRNLRPSAYKVIRGISMTVCERLRETNSMIRNVLDESGEAVPLPTETKHPSEGTQGGLLGRLPFWRGK